MDVNIKVPERFKNFINDWDYEIQLSVGGYGSGKSYSIAQKIIIKLLLEKRKCLVIRNVFDTIKDSCYDLLKEILETMNLKSENIKKGVALDGKCIVLKSPMEIKFPNGSTIIFRGLDNPEKLKSINNVSIVWIEECSEITFDSFEEILGRVRTPGVSLHFILSCNPVGRECWVYRFFFSRVDEQGKETLVCDEKELYKRKTMVCSIGKKQEALYIHSTMDDNPFLPQAYRDRIDDIRSYDVQKWIVARLGMFGANGWKVLPNFMVAKNAKEFKKAVLSCSAQFHFFGLDFGYEKSFNALIACCVDDENKILYIYDEVYVNQITDDVFIQREDVCRIYNRAYKCDKIVCADCAEPKTIQYYNLNGMQTYPCEKYAGSRLQNTKKLKRFHKIICSPLCVNTIRELRDLTYKKDSRGNIIYDDFTIDPHTMSALWYALNDYVMADEKELKTNSRR